jgi:formylglycine-generating enzyme required for sulfatase activity
MGSEKGHDNEKPVHMVVVLFSFMMDKYEITNEKYFTYECLNERCKDYNSWAGANHFRANPSCPVNELNWNDAKGYSYFLCMKLPSEAQWEYACRAGTTTEYYFGDNNDTLPEYSWYWANYKYDETQVVGKKKPNNWGLYDMYGNVWEWCNDWYSETFYSESPSINPQGPSTGSWHVVRGGGWISDTEECRSASRNYNSFSLRYGGGGFRLISPSGK